MDNKNYRDLAIEAIQEDISTLNYQDESFIDISFYAFLLDTHLTDEVYIDILSATRPLLKDLCIKHVVEDDKIKLIKVVH